MTRGFETVVMSSLIQCSFHYYTRLSLKDRSTMSSTISPLDGGLGFFFKIGNFRRARCSSAFHGSKCGYVGATKGGVAHVRRQAKIWISHLFCRSIPWLTLFVGFRQYVGAEWVSFESRFLACTPKSFVTSDRCTLLKYILTNYAGMHRRGSPEVKFCRGTLLVAV